MHTQQHPYRDLPLPSLPAAQNVTRKAERELAAFLRAAEAQLDGCGIARASELWLQIMEDLEWSCEDVEKFFRTVSVRAISQLVEHFTPQAA